MIRFTCSGGVDPLLRAELDLGDVLFAENNAMVAMDQTLSLTGKAQGGFFSSLGRKFLNDENFFQQRISAENGSGAILLAPNIPGDLRIVDIGEKQYNLADGAYLASTEKVELSTKTQSIGKALLSRSGGFFIMQTAGSGQMVISGFGSMHTIEVTPDKPLLVDNGHLVAWDASLSYDITLNTSHKGIFGKLMESTVSGEGFVLKFKGHGNVFVCSRNRGGFIDWIMGNLQQLKAVKNG